MSAEQPALLPNQSPRFLRRAARITGDALSDTVNDPDLHVHLAHLGSAGLEASGIVHRNASGHRRLSMRGIGHAVKQPKETLGEALGGVTAELAPVALYAGTMLVSNLATAVFNRGPKVENAVNPPVAGAGVETGPIASSASPQAHLSAVGHAH